MGENSGNGNGVCRYVRARYHHNQKVHKDIENSTVKYVAMILNGDKNQKSNDILRDKSNHAL